MHHRRWLPKHVPLRAACQGCTFRAQLGMVMLLGAGLLNSPCDAERTGRIGRRGLERTGRQSLERVTEGSSTSVQQWECPGDLSDILHHQRVVSFADWHGDYDHAVQALQKLGLVDNQLHWSGGSTIMVHTGDVIDRGNDDIKLVLLLWRLQSEAKNAGGQVLLVLGNHELMNMQYDVRYVSECSRLQYVTHYKNLTDDVLWQQLDASAQQLDKVVKAKHTFEQFVQSPSNTYCEQMSQQTRIAKGKGTYDKYSLALKNVFEPVHKKVWSKNGDLGSKVRSAWRVVHQVQDVLYVHGNVLPQHVGLELLDQVPANDRIHVLAGSYDLTKAKSLEVLAGDNSMLWNRGLSEDQLINGESHQLINGESPRACKQLAKVLQRVNATLLIKGHDVTSSAKPKQGCYNNTEKRFQVILADTMMSLGYTQNAAESRMRTVALEWYGSSNNVRAAFPLQEPRACYNLQPRGCTADMLLHGSSFGACKYLSVKGLQKESNKLPHQLRWGRLAEGTPGMIKNRINTLGLMHAFNSATSTCPEPVEKETVTLCRGGDCITHNKEPLHVSCDYDHTACSLNDLQRCEYIVGKLPTGDPKKLLIETSFNKFVNHLPAPAHTWLSREECPELPNYTHPAKLQHIGGLRDVQAWCERQCRFQMILEYKTGFSGKCDMLEAKMDHWGKADELTRENMFEWERELQSQVGQQQQFNLSTCMPSVSNRNKVAEFPLQPGSKLTLICKNCRVDEKDVVGLEEGAFGLISQRAGLKVTVLHRDLWSQKLISEERRCGEFERMWKEQNFGCSGGGWLLCCMRSENACVRLACVSKQDLAPTAGQDACSGFKPSGVHKQRKGNLVFQTVQREEIEDSETFDLGHWVKVDDKPWKFKSFLPFPQRNKYVDPCSWVTGAVGRVKGLQNDGDCKCEVKKHRIQCLPEKTRHFFLAVAHSSVACLNKDTDTRKCA
mmetsp:Transcript_108750/g.210469  ORF Transcript_108750/g.210469 Transcript_108750/m.210469 type:complete len:950 (-) Transcript_108750:58-2907(-)